MARIDGLPSLEIIKGFKGLLDFVAWRGIFYVRSWPRTSRIDLTQPTLAAASLFGQIVKAYSLLAAPVLDFYQQDAADQPRTARDLHVQATLGHLHIRTELPPPPPPEEQVVLTDRTNLTDTTVSAPATWEPWGTERIEFDLDGEDVEIIAWLSGSISNFLTEGDIRYLRIDISLDNGASWLAGRDPFTLVAPMGGGTYTYIPASANHRAAGLVTTKAIVRAMLRQSANANSTWRQGSLLAAAIYTPT